MDGRSGSGNGGGVAAGANAVLNGNAPPPFLSKTYDMVDDPATDAIVSWGSGNNSFVVWNTPEFARDLLPKYFKHNNFSSFVRQLNTYGFRKIDPDRWEFANEGFLRGQKHLLKNINRRKSSHTHTQPQQHQAQNASVAACVEVGKFGLEEEIERLKRDKNVLMQELVRLRQQQQTTDNQLQTLGQRLQGMEQRQQQMMSFLAKAMHSPGFLAQLVQQNDSNRRITGVNKKRRLPRQEGSSLEGETASSPDGQMVKYQPLMNEAAKEMLMQILKFDTSPRLESLSNSDSNFLIENHPSQSSSGNSGVTLAEVPPSSGMPPHIPVSSEFSAVCSSSGISDEIQSSSELLDIGMVSAVPEAIPCEFPLIQEIVPDGRIADIPVPSEILTVPEAESVYIDPIGVVETMPIEIEKFPIDTDIDLFDDGEQKLPGIIDSFWEQFLMASPFSGETQEVDSCLEEAKEMQQPVAESGANNTRNMDNLTKQMGLLTSDSKG